MNIQETKTRHGFSLIINRNYSFFWRGQLVSNLGDVVFDITLILWIAASIAQNQTWAPFAVSGLLFAATIPILVVAPVAGVFVDRCNKRQVMLWMDIARALLISVPLLMQMGLRIFPNGHMPVLAQLVSIYIVVILVSSCTQFFNPSRLAFIGDIVNKSDQARASGLAQISMNFSTIIGPVLASVLFFAVGVQWSLIINMSSFVCSFIAILAIHLPHLQTNSPTNHRKSFWFDFGTGLHFFVQTPILLTVVISLIMATAGITAINALDVFFVVQNLHVPVSMYGFLSMAFGLGSVLGTTMAMALAQRIGIIRVFWSSLLLIGFLLLIYARLNTFWSGLSVMFLLGLPFGALLTAFNPLLLHITPRELLGRVFAIFSPCISLVTLLSSAFAGYLASTALYNFHATLLGVTFGSIDSIFLGTGVLVIIGGLYASFHLRNVRLDGN